MKVAFTLGLLSVFALTACEIDEPPPRRNGRQPGRYPNPQQTQYPAQPQPFPQDGAQPTSPPVVTEERAPEAPSTPSTPTNPSTPKGDYPYAIPVPGKPGFVRSPYSPDKMTDVRGYAPGTEVKDPYTQKIFLVP